MELKQQLINFGCGIEFIDIALGYAQFYQADQDIEAFIEYVEEEHAKVEAAEEIEKMDKEIIDASGLFEEFEGDAAE